MSSEPQNHDLRHDAARRRASPGIALSPDEKVEIAKQLERLGVDIVEAGFAVSSPGDFEGVRAVAAAIERPTVASLARTRKEDIDAAAEALAGAHRSRIHVFLATSPIHMERKLRLEPEEVVEQARWSVGYAAASSTRSSSPARTRRAPSPSSRLACAPRPSGPARRRSTCPTRSATASPASTPTSSPRSGASAPSSRT